jgi:hypothetical protein
MPTRVRARENGTDPMKYWEITADNLSKAGWSWGCVSAIDSNGRTIFVGDAHRDGGKRFVVRADEKLTAFVELESAICAVGPIGCSAWLGECARLRRTTSNTTEIAKFVVTFVVTRPFFWLISGDFTYENRRGRESNPRIAVLQTATLPLGYPAVLRDPNYPDPMHRCQRKQRA